VSLDIYWQSDIANALQAIAVAHGPMGDEARQVWLAMGLAFGLALAVTGSQGQGVPNWGVGHALMIPEGGHDVQMVAVPNTRGRVGPGGD